MLDRNINANAIKAASGIWRTQVFLRNPDRFKDLSASICAFVIIN